MRISRQSRPGNIAGVVAGIIRDNEVATIESIGVKTNYVCVKAMALVRSFLEADGIDISISIRTENKLVKGSEVTEYVWEVKGIKRP